jgi:DNA-binding NarL/FixJ family response regulator
MSEAAATRVLIVDDHAEFRADAHALLMSAGYDVVGEAHDAASAIAAVSALRPDVLLLDIRLPDRDGFSVAADLNSQQSRPRIILISSREAGDYGSLVDAANVDGFICKSELSPTRLAEVLDDCA